MIPENYLEVDPYVQAVMCDVLIQMSFVKTQDVPFKSVKSSMEVSEGRHEKRGLQHWC